MNTYSNRGSNDSFVLRDKVRFSRIKGKNIDSAIRHFVVVKYQSEVTG
jgi:hypothetical protein